MKIVHQTTSKKYEALLFEYVRGTTPEEKATDGLPLLRNAREIHSLVQKENLREDPLKKGGLNRMTEFSSYTLGGRGVLSLEEKNKGKGGGENCLRKWTLIRLKKEKA